MAFSDGETKFWHIDLTTRAGAQSAASQGGIACFVFAGMCVLGALLAGGTIGFDTPYIIGAMAGVLMESVLAVIAGFRMRAYKGFYWGLAAAALATLELLVKVMTLSLGELLIGTIVLIYMVNGLRAVRALKSQYGFADDSAVFE